MSSEKLEFDTTPGTRKCTVYATVSQTPDALLKQIDKVREPWRWDPIKSRIEQNWKFWVQAAEELYKREENVKLEMKQVHLLFLKFLFPYVKFKLLLNSQQ